MYTASPTPAAARMAARRRVSRTGPMEAGALGEWNVEGTGGGAAVVAGEVETVMTDCLRPAEARPSS
jgi:hypothetical protein